ncbi:hypothetical protein E2C01_091715 [Portunus trituberculatus]|uniref:Uncharacterized protein n=1 Tax=Portunus trituberculatus TaxID=210409 RepID=A0A5B7JQ45_PORTR|nr:hypothetical protein [Portunus trituberculatus]
MLTIVRGFTEGVNQLRAIKSTENCQVRSTLAAKGSYPIAGSEMTPGSAGSSSVASVSETGISHQGEYENSTRVRTTCQVMSTLTAATKGTSPSAGLEVTPERVGGKLVIRFSV